MTAQKTLRQLAIIALTTPFITGTLLTKTSQAEQFSSLADNPNNSEQIEINQPQLIAGLDDFLRPAERVFNIWQRTKRDNESAKIRQERHELQLLNQQQRIQERQQREAERQQREADLAAARRAATLKQLEQARQIRETFDKMTPEEQQEYIYKLEETRQKKAEANLALLGLAAEFFIGGMTNGDGASSSEASPEHIRVYERPNSAPQPTPQPTKPISPFYGGCHHAGC